MRVAMLTETVYFFQTNDILERISNEDTSIQLRVYKEIQKDLLTESPLKTFQREANYEIMLQEDDEGIINNGKIEEREAVEICLICAMARIDYFDLLKNSGELLKALRRVKGENEKIAKNFEKFIREGNLFSQFKPDSMLRKILN